MKVYIKTVTPAYIETTNHSSQTKEFQLDFNVVEYDVHFNRMNKMTGTATIPADIDSIDAMREIIYNQIQKGLNAKD